jgi:uncharacterized protein (TIGR03067 family)
LVLLALGVAGLAAGVACSGDADFSDAIGEITTLPAEEYRAEIMELDRLAFEPTAMDDARRARLGARFEALARRVKAAGDTRFLTLESLELRRLATASERMPAEQIQNQWMRIRNNLFDDREWFARSASDLDALAAYEPTPAPAVPTAAPAIPVEEPEPSPRFTAGPPPAPELEGRWTIVEITSNGKPNADQKLLGATLEIRGNRFRLERAPGHIQEYSFTVLRDAGGTVLYVQNDPGARDENGWVLYEVSDGVLRMALYDGLGKRPTGFTAPEGTEPELIVLRLERKSSQAGRSSP